MSTEPAFATWLQNSLTSLFGPTPDDEDPSVFPTRFKRAFSPNAHVNLNLEKISVDALEEHIKNETALANQVAKAQLDWKEIFGVTEGHEEGGLVVGYFIVTRTMNFRIRVTPAKQLEHKFFSAKIVKDANVQPDGEGNSWRISQFFLTEVNRPAPISLHPIES